MLGRQDLFLPVSEAGLSPVLRPATPILVQGTQYKEEGIMGGGQMEIRGSCPAGRPADPGLQPQ